MSILPRSAKSLTKALGAKNPICSAISSRTRRPFGTVKAILREDVVNRGYKGEEVVVRGGYMRNFLYPKKLAVYATAENKELFQTVQQSRNQEKIDALKGLTRMRRILSKVSVSFKRHVPQPGMQPKEVTAQNVSDFLLKARKLEIPADNIEMPHNQPITSLGEHLLRIRVTFEPEIMAMLENDLGPEAFEKQSWVNVMVTVVKR